MFASWYCLPLGIGGWILMVALWAGVIAVVIWAVSRLFPTGAVRRRADPPGPPGPPSGDGLGAGTPDARSGTEATDPAGRDLLDRNR